MLKSLLTSSAILVASFVLLTANFSSAVDLEPMVEPGDTLDVEVFSYCNYISPTLIRCGTNTFVDRVY